MRLQGLVCCVAVAVAGCSHDQPFETPASGSSTPFLPGTPVRLTNNPGKDLHPAWNADGGSFWYSLQESGQPDKDQCLGQLPATGGSRLAEVCNISPSATDTTDIFDVPSTSPDGQILYIRSSSRIGALAPNASGVYLAPLSNPLSATQVLHLGYTVPGEAVVQAYITSARWASPTRLFYVGESVNYIPPCDQCPPDTVNVGIEVIDLDLRGAQPTLSVVPGTYGATSTDLSVTGDTLYYTLWGDSRVYRRALATGQVNVAHDFGALGIARDVTVLGSRLVAVVGGQVSAVVDPIFGPVQLDAGGPLISVDMATGSESPLPTDNPMLFRRPAFAHAGNPTRLVVEGYPLSGTTVSAVGDLYMYVAP
jgi:hypothetical protein